jgi:hypothetical protein
LLLGVRYPGEGELLFDRWKIRLLEAMAGGVELSFRSCLPASVRGDKFCGEVRM